ncbi:MAG: ATP-binding cassette domain-containing protein, partial [Acidimicrobiia bacterium]|nr:ATP-binding cassette domain-containing protein [Acidimicrobiia bacterium]
MPFRKLVVGPDGSGGSPNREPDQGPLGPAIELDRVSVVRGDKRVVSEFTTTVPTGAVIGLLGPSGCGKTTLMRSIVGVQANVAGELRVLGCPAGDPRLRSEVGYLAQGQSLYEDLSVRENIGYFS